MTENTGFSIINLRDGGEVRLWFPEEINTDDSANWETADVAGGTKPSSFGNSEPQQISINDLCIDNTRTNASVEPTIETLNLWMRSDEKNGAPPDLMILTAGWQKRAVLTKLSVKRNFFHEGVCVRAYLSLSFDALPSSGMQIEVTPRRRSGNSLSGNTFR